MTFGVASTCKNTFEGPGQLRNLNGLAGLPERKT